MKRHEALRIVSDHAAGQWGLVTTSQAKLAGLNSVDLLRLAEADLLESVGRGVYLVAGAAPPDHLEIKVAWLRLEPGTLAWKRQHPETYGGVVSHGSACDLHHLGDLPTSTVEISVPRRRTTREDGVRLHRATLEASDVTIVDGLPVTTAERTVVDLLAARVDGAHVGGVVADTVRQGLTNDERLAERIASFAHSYGLPRSSSGRELLDYLVEQADRGLPVSERTRITQNAAIQGFASALALIANAQSGQNTEISAAIRNILAGLPFDSGSASEATLADFRTILAGDHVPEWALERAAQEQRASNDGKHRRDPNRKTSSKRRKILNINKPSAKPKPVDRNTCGKSEGDET
ncbi:type IV toxin-antitoxin system AbiEi family antitoxin domain-containing protein [Acrocarpospora sp. B8E8]|uniref:type IV toxin-antitoxin system AbiEi family antitoxin domain-containing protein n=1 Tax=Acrocarpospora sp. B8E8 TaxID=3153572 RepID=UPI00325EA714